MDPSGGMWETEGYKSGKAVTARWLPSISTTQPNIVAQWRISGMGARALGEKLWQRPFPLPGHTFILPLPFSRKQVSLATALATENHVD